VAGTLYLVPNLLGVVAPERVLPAQTLAVARGVAHWVVETPKAARAFLGTIGVGGDRDARHSAADGCA
jgi:16S rRNA (cytidine1402-2'-O)-methyltransferase